MWKNVETHGVHNVLIKGLSPSDATARLKSPDRNTRENEQREMKESKKCKRT